MTRLSPLLALIPLLALTPACGEEGPACTVDRLPDVVGASGAILPANLTYRALRTFGQFDGFAIVARDATTNRCIRLRINQENRADPIPSLVTNLSLPVGYAVKQVEITDVVAECVAQGGDEPQPTGCRGEPAAGASGWLSLSGSGSGASVSFHATLLFTTNSLVPPQPIELDAANLAVTDGL